MKNNCCPSTYSITNFIRLGFCWFRNNFFFSFLVAALLLIVAAFFTIVRFFSLYCLVYGYIYCLLLLWGREKDIERAHTFYLLNTYYSFVCCLSAFLVGSVHALIIFRYTMKFAHKKKQQQNIHNNNNINEVRVRKNNDRMILIGCVAFERNYKVMIMLFMFHKFENWLN